MKNSSLVFNILWKKLSSLAELILGIKLVKIYSNHFYQVKLTRQYIIIVEVHFVT